MDKYWNMASVNCGEMCIRWFSFFSANEVKSSSLGLATRLRLERLSAETREITIMTRGLFVFTTAYTTCATYYHAGKVGVVREEKREKKTGLRTKDVRLVHDFRLNELFDDVFEGDEAYDFVEGIALAFVVDALHERHVPLVSCVQQLLHILYKYILYSSFANLSNLKATTYIMICARFVVRTFLELLEHDVQCDVFKHEIARILVKLTERLERRIVIGVDECQIFDVEHGYYVGPACFENWDSRVACR